MRLGEAIEQLLLGKKVKLPEWTGYWFIPEGDACGNAEHCIKAFCKNGDIAADHAWVDKYRDRDDFEVTEGNMGFDFAILALKNGKKVARAGWNGKNMWVHLQVPDRDSKMGHPYPYMKGVDNKMFPWNPNALDLLAEDWCVVGE